MDTNRLVDCAFRCVQKVIRSLKPVILNRQGSEVLRTREDGDVTRKVDALSEEICLRHLEALGMPLLVFSEEAGEIEMGTGAEIAVLIDPIDGSYMAIRGIPLCSISISFHTLPDLEPLVGAVGNFFTEEVYLASEKGAFRDTTPLRVSSVKRLEEAFLVSHIRKSYGVEALAKQKDLVEKPRLWLNYGGALEMVKLAEGCIDAFVEFTAGYNSYDYSAGAFIAEKAGAMVTDLEGNLLKVHLKRQRNKFIITATPELHQQVMNILRT